MSVGNDSQNTGLLQTFTMEWKGSSAFWCNTLSISLSLLFFWYFYF